MPGGAPCDLPLSGKAPGSPTEAAESRSPVACDLWALGQQPAAGIPGELVVRLPGRPHILAFPWQRLGQLGLAGTSEHLGGREATPCILMRKGAWLGAHRGCYGAAARP